MIRFLIKLDEDRNELQTKRKLVLLKGCIHDHPLYLVCPGLLQAVGETSYGIRVEFIGSTHSHHYLFMYLFVSEVLSLLLSIESNKSHILKKKKKTTFASLQNQ
jgi:hypothetical protein